MSTVQSIIKSANADVNTYANSKVVASIETSAIVTAACLLLLLMCVIIIKRHKIQLKIKRLFLYLFSRRNYFEYDIFVCFARSQKLWVRDVLQKHLEQKYGYRVLVSYEHDYMAKIVEDDNAMLMLKGSYELANVHGVDKSRCGEAKCFDGRSTIGHPLTSNIQVGLTSSEKNKATCQNDVIASSLKRDITASRCVIMVLDKNTPIPYICCSPLIKNSSGTGELYLNELKNRRIINIQLGRRGTKEHPGDQLRRMIVQPKMDVLWTENDNLMSKVSQVGGLVRKTVPSYWGVVSGGVRRACSSLCKRSSGEKDPLLPK